MIVMVATVMMMVVINDCNDEDGSYNGSDDAW